MKGVKVESKRLVFEAPVYQVYLVSKETVAILNRTLCSPEDAVKILQDYLKGTDREHFVGLYLNSANHLIGIHTISVGILNSSLVHPREVFKLAYMMNAASIIVAHNHPSGNAEPSSEDITMTKQLVEAGKILGIPLHDHIIVTEQNGYTSFAERGLI
jgi:DNA repair protein RadC